ncbi:AAA family ATPase [Ornithinibacillus caprae]|nr:AAA family ATPase [Ornithinibacillus caprae]
MKLLRATIFGFAKWVDFDIDFRNENLTIIYGENESGKSSLHKFILFMLFGLPPKQRTFYRPKTSSKMGGRLTVQDPDYGEFIIERMDDTRNGAAICYTPDGLEHNEKWLQECLGGMNQEAYHNIFSFSANDLSSIRKMKENDMGEVLLGIGLTGSVHIHSIEKKLDTKIAEMFKPYGKKPVINQQIQALQGHQMTLTEMQQEEATYRQKQIKLIELTTEMDRLTNNVRTEREHVLLLEKKLQALPAVHEYHKYSNQLKEIPSYIPFPEEGINRLQSLKEKVVPLQSEMSVLKANEQRQKNQQLQLEQSLSSKKSSEKLVILLDKQEKFKEQKNELFKINDSMQKLNLRIQTELEDMNLGITRKDLKEIRLPFHIEKTWNELKSNQEQLELEQKLLNEDIHLVEQTQTFIEEQLHELEAELLTNEQKNQLHEKLEHYSKSKLVEKLQQEEKIKAEKWRKNKKVTEKRSTTILLASIALAVILGITGIFTDWDILVTVAVISFIIGIGQWGWSRRSLLNMEKLFEQSMYIPSEGNLTDREKEDAERLLERDHENKNEQKLLLEQLKSTDIQRIQLQEKQSVKKGSKEQLQKKIQEQQQIYPFLRNVDVPYWTEVFHTLKSILRMQSEKEELEAEYQVIQRNVSLFEKEVEKALQEEGVDTSNTTEEQLKWIEEEWNDFIKAKESLSQVKKLISENNQHQQNVKQKIEVYQNEIDLLFKSAEVSNEDEFYQQASVLEEREKWLELRSKIIQQYKQLFSNDQWQKLVEQRPQQSSVELEIQQAKEMISNMEATIQELQQQIADIKIDLSKMESSESYSKMLHQFHMNKEQLNVIAKEWATYKTAKELLTETKRNYRKKYQSKVIEQTSYYFQKITGGAYIHVFAPTEEKLFLVESKDNIRYTVEELSQGTIDQLYVSLRLAIGEIMTKENHLPFIIDDAFVHFDAIRTEKVLRILDEIAEKQQVLLFSCRKEILESTTSNVIKLTNQVPLMENK